MVERVQFLWIAFAIHFFVDSAHAQSCMVPESDQDAKFPDFFGLAKTSYSLQVEANFFTNKSTVVITEVYDIVNARGQLDIESIRKDAFPSRMVYFDKTDELFHAKPGVSCQTTKLSDVNNDRFAKDFNVWNWVDVTKGKALVGPSNILRRAFQVWTSEGSKVIGRDSKSVKVRGMNAHVWAWCVQGTDTTVKLYFSDPVSESPFGLQQIPVPLKVTVVGLWQNVKFIQTYDFVNVQLGLSDDFLQSAIAIPRMVGCKRLVPDQFQMPTYAGNDMSIDAEIVYTPFLKNAKNYTYVSNLRLILDEKSGHAAVQMTPWKAHKDAEMAEPGDNLFFVMDTKNEFTYKIDKTMNACNVTVYDDQPSKITLPDGFKLDLVNVLIGAADDDGYHFLGFGEERGIPVSIFERVDNNDTTFETIITTRYHIIDGTDMETEFVEKKAPLKIDYWVVNLGDQEFLGFVSVNFFAFQSALTKKNTLFDVRPCFKEDTQSKWIQIVFPLDNEAPYDMIPQIPYIQENFQGAVQEFIVGLNSPLRLPTVVIDVDAQNLYATILLLERAPFMLDFKLKYSKSQLKAPTDSVKLVGLTTLEDCAKSCLQEIVCPLFSYCGAICTVAMSQVGGGVEVEDKEGCEMYENVKMETSLPTMDEVTKSFASAVETRSITLLLNVPRRSGRILDLTATVFKDDLAFGLQGLSRKPEVSLESRFNIFKYAAKLVSNASDEISAKNLGPQSFSSCKQFCLDSASCESLSFCMATQECALSSLHGEEFPTGSFEDNTQCLVLSRNYVDYFQRYPGITLDHESEKPLEFKTIESCAKACKMETDFDCESFDFCPNNEGGDNKICLLHKEHFTDIKEANHLKVDKKCGHYSRKYVYDFKMQRHKVIGNDKDVRATGRTIVNVSAEQCAQQCKDIGDCQGFYHCPNPHNFASVCTLVTSAPGKMLDDPTCTAFLPSGDMREDIIKNKMKAVHFQEEGHSKSSTGGLGFLMMLIGLAVGFGAVFGYGYYKANRRVV